MDNLSGVVRLLKKEQDRLTKELRGIGAALAAFGNAYGKGKGTRRLALQHNYKEAIAHFEVAKYSVSSAGPPVVDSYALALWQLGRKLDAYNELRFYSFLHPWSVKELRHWHLIMGWKPLDS